jgi:hypothetical protein
MDLSPLLKRKPDFRSVSHGNPVPWFNLGNPAIPNLGIRGFPRLRHLWSSGPPTGYGGQASHDYSWFGFIGFI